MNVHAVVVNWNGGEQNLRCLESLYASTLVPVVHLVDNGSTDGSLSLVIERYPSAIIHRSEENRGFSAGVNVGIEAALAAGADHVFLLNNDATVDPECLSALAGAAASNPLGGAFGPRIYLDRGKDLLWCCGVKLGFYPNLCRLRGLGKKGAGRYLETEAVDSLTGCGMFLPRETLRDVGLMDERWFVYVEDADYCERIKKAKKTCVYVANAFVEHAGAGSTGGGYSPARKYLSAHGAVGFLRRHGTPTLIGSFLVFDVFLWPLLYVVSLFRGRSAGALAKGRGIVDGILRRPADRRVVDTPRSERRS